MTRFIHSILVTLLLFPISGIIAQSAIDTAIRRIMKEHEVVGLSVAVVKKNDIVFSSAYGYNNLQTQTPLQTENLFRIASISKSFSATSIMQLVEQKKMGLDQDVSELIGFPVRHPKFPSTVITVRMLLSHTSSINDSQGYFSLDAIDPSKNTNWEKCYNTYEPGKGWQYCNLNFNMIGTIIERVSGERFDLYVRKHVLDPLGLYGGYAVDSLDRSKLANIYEFNTDSSKYIVSAGAYNPRSEEIAAYTMGYSTPIFSPTGGMKISAPDLARYMIMHKNRGKYKGVRILSKKSAVLMQTPVSTYEPYGLALEQTDKLIPGKLLTGHTGVAYGLYSAMFFDPKENYGIVVITNGTRARHVGDYNNTIRYVVNALYQHVVLK